MMIDDQVILDAIDLKTKPQGSLGKLEELAFKICRIQKTIQPCVDNASILVFCGDHGLSENPISCYPQEVTKQMVYNFNSEGAAINVFSNLYAMDLKVIDCGVKDLNVKSFVSNKNFINARISNGTNDCLRYDSMTQEELESCFSIGQRIIQEHISSATNVFAFGEMGIGNTSASSLIMSQILNLDIEDCVGKGTGLEESELGVKKQILTDVIKRHPNIECPLEALRKFGGFEMAQMTSAMLEVYRQGKIILIDGFISTTCFLVAYKVNKSILNNVIFSHCSDEKAHSVLLSYFKEDPILNLGLRLGEGTGAALSYPILKAACAFMNQMSTFKQAQVSERLV